MRVTWLPGRGCVRGTTGARDKHKRAPTKKGNNWLKPALVEAAKAAGRTKTYLGAQYQRLARRIGANRAAMAEAHSIAVIIYQIIKTESPSSTWPNSTSNNAKAPPPPAGMSANSNASGTKSHYNQPEHAIFIVMTGWGSRILTAARITTDNEKALGPLTPPSFPPRRNHDPR